MPIDFHADLDEMLDADEFAVPVTHAGNSFRGILNLAYAESLGAEGYRPSLIVRTVDVPTAAHGQPLVADGTAYTIRGVQPDGTGETVLELEAK